MIKAAIVGLGWWGQTILRTLLNSTIIAPVLAIDPAGEARASAAALGVETTARFEDALAKHKCRCRHPLHAATASRRTDHCGGAVGKAHILREAAMHPRGRCAGRDR